MDFNLVIKNGHIIDGTGNPWFSADIGVRDGRIAKVSHVALNDADKVIDAEALMICPGFINLHSHSDGSILAHNNAENCLAMGLVTELTGQCGSSVAPITEKYKENISKKVKGGINQWEGEVDWLTLDDWIKKLEVRGIGINIAPLVGHGTIRTCVMGENGEGGEKIVPTTNEMKGMKTILEGAMRDGAFGLSTGLNYVPGRNTLTDEVVELEKVVAKFGGVYTSHMRCEGDMLIEATMEFISICERAGTRGTISHLKANGRRNFGKVNETIRLVDAARARGVDVIIDSYPWNIGGGRRSLGSQLRVSYTGEGSLHRKELVKKLKDDAEWEKIKAETMKSRTKEEELYRVRKEKIEEKGGWTSPPNPYAVKQSGVILYSKTHPELVGKTMLDVAEFFGAEDFLEGIRAILIEDEGYTVAGAEPYSEDDIVTILKYPWTTVSTDSSALDTTKIPSQYAADNVRTQHPRGWGTYAKILGKYVREDKLLTLEEAVRKMTSLPAQFLGLQDRGLVREGFWADLVIFDPESVGNIATHGSPQLHPRGIPYVLVNGEIAVDGGELTGARAGKVLRHNA